MDQARILLGVGQVSDIPQSTNIFINGEKFCIRMDQRCWIDDMAENQGAGEESGKFEVIESDIKVVELHSPDSLEKLTDLKWTNLAPLNIL
ncbi:hypothetical protein V6N13_117105 [Hibiscus sabdariffa]|uniref:Uncharacterized protein n=2 Tax=Hibiscus sabdariffa TaxID=183260 RepID=A0ABR1ZH01_9ROSI